MNFVRNVWKVWFGNILVINYQDTSRTLVGSNTYNMGFGASSGGYNASHLIRNIQITKFSLGPWRPTAGGATPGISYNGPVITGASTRASFIVSLGTTLLNTTQICNITGTINGTYNINVTLTQSRYYNDIVKTYQIPIIYGSAFTNFYRCLPVTNTGIYAGNDFALEVTTNSSSLITYLRVVRTAVGTNINSFMTAFVELQSDSYLETLSLNYDGTTGSNATNSGYYLGSPVSNIGASSRYTYTIILAATLNASTQICYLQDPTNSCAYMINVTLVQARNYQSILKSYVLPVSYNYLSSSSSSWSRCISTTNTGINGLNDFALEIIVNPVSYTTYLRIVRTALGVNVNTGITCFIEVISDAGYPITVTYDGTQNTGASNVGIYSANPIGTVQGNVGILTSNPQFPLHVTMSNGSGGTICLNSPFTNEVSIRWANSYNSWIAGISSYIAGSNFCLGSGTNGGILYVTHSGYVGINNSLPSYPLDVNGGIRLNNQLNFNNQVQPNMLCLYGNANIADTTNNFGFGISNYTLLYNAPSGAHHQFNIGGTEMARIASTGYLGIETTSPVLPFHLYNTNGSMCIQTNSTTNESSIRWSNINYCWYSGLGTFSTVSNWSIGVNNTVMSLSPGGNVGIGNGMTNPQVVLDVGGTIRTSAQLNFNNQNQPNMICLFGNCNLADNSNNYGFGISNSTLLYNVDQNGHHQFQFKGNEIARITSNGFGVFNTNPQFSIDINGNCRINNNVARLYISGTNGGGGSTSAAICFSTYGFLGSNSSGQDQSGCCIQAVDDGNYGAHMQFNTRNNGGATPNYPKMTLTDAGQLGIGSNFYPSYTLDANGNTCIRSNLYFNNQLYPNVLALWGSSNINDSSNSYGFGIAGNTLLYNVPNTARHQFNVGGSEIARFVSNGILMTNNDNTFIGVNAGGTPTVGIVKKYGYGPVICSTNTANIAWGTLQSTTLADVGNSNLTIWMTLTNNGYLGINNAAPAYQLDITGNARASGSLLIGSSTDTSRAISALYSNLATNNTLYFTLGQSASSLNEAEFSFYYSGSGSTNNGLGLGFYSNRVLYITAAGNVGINNGSPGYALDVTGNAHIYNGANARLIISTGGGSSTATGVDMYVYNGQQNPASSIYAIDDGNYGGHLTFLTKGSGSSSTSTTEKMRITDNGSVGIGTTSPSYTLDISGTFRANTNNGAAFLVSAIGVIPNSGAVSQFVGVPNSRSAIDLYSASTNTQYIMNFFNTNGPIGSISITGSSTSFNTSSDRRLKTQFEPISNAISSVEKLNPISFVFKKDVTQKLQGFIADEVSDIVPIAVTGQKDEIDKEGNPVYQSLDMSKLIPILTAALQEVIDDNTSLKKRVSTLENEIKNIYTFLHV